jgi:pyridoxamine 5'-phosphate oxidase
MTSRDLSALRREYESHSLDVKDVASDPFAQFAKWFDDTSATEIHEPNAMTLATATRDGVPSARMVLLKGVDARGFVFFTNYTSRKGHELDHNPRAALVFYWDELHRQVRVEGAVEKVSREESDAYFAARPVGSRIGAWASPQSEVVEGREVLDARVREVTERFEGGAIPRPEFWGGYRVVPSCVEFWQGRTSRMHDRVRYCRDGDGWRIERLAP